jgi:hypothetical protein
LQLEPAQEYPEQRPQIKSRALPVLLDGLAPGLSNKAAPQLLLLL